MHAGWIHGWCIQTRTWMLWHCVCVCVYLHGHTRTHTNRHIYARTHTRQIPHNHKCACAHTYTNTYTQRIAQTQTQTSTKTQIHDTGHRTQEIIQTISQTVQYCHRWYRECCLTNWSDWAYVQWVHQPGRARKSSADSTCNKQTHTKDHNI